MWYIQKHAMNPGARGGRTHQPLKIWGRFVLALGKGYFIPLGEETALPLKDSSSPDIPGRILPLPDVACLLFF